MVNMVSEEVEELLISKEDHDPFISNWEHERKARAARRRNDISKNIVLGALIILPWIGTLWFWRSWQSCRSRYYIRPDLTYSPLQDIVKYETKIFTFGPPTDDQVSPYTLEPSDEVDKLWTDLYPSLYQLIPRETATKLVNQTVLFPHDEQKRYVIEIDVFHQLHCLNMVRKATRPDYYHPDNSNGEEDVFLGHTHIAHCIDIIRQSLMCASDITVYTWQWREDLGYYANQVKNPHVCRNFDALREWSRVNTERVEFDYYSREPNDPLDPSTWIDGYTGE